jgi:SAM-dependent methyltransferase
MSEVYDERALSFGSDAERYDRARPSYPAELVERLLEGSPRTVLDVGCGTGKAARLFAERGCTVLGVEPDEQMAAIARSHDLEVELARFEEWQPRGRIFDLVVSGQAWHWLEREQAVERVAAVLTPGGRFAAFWNLPRLDDDLQADVDRVYADCLPDGKPQGAARAEYTAARAADLAALEASAAFRDAEFWTFSREEQYTRDAFLDLQRTHSNNIVLPAEQRERLLEAIGAVLAAHGDVTTLRLRVEAVTAVCV